MKLPYVVALARHIEEPKQMIWEKMYTGRRPKEVLRGTQMKLLNPRTRIATPVNLTTYRKPVSTAPRKPYDYTERTHIC